MSNLILPNRRLFMQTLTAAFTGVVAAPVIIKATNLMEINSPRNRLIWAYDYPDGYGLFKESGINASHAWDA